MVVGACWGHLRTSLLISDICRGCDICAFCAYLSWLSCVLNSVLLILVFFSYWEGTKNDHRHLSFADAWRFLWHLHHGWGWYPVWPFPCHSTSTRPWNSRAKEETRCMLKKMLPHWQLYMLEDVGSIRKQWIDLGDRKNSLETGTRISKLHKCQSNSINVIPGIPHNVPSTLLLETAIPRGNPPKTLPLCSNMFSLAGYKHWHGYGSIPIVIHF